VVPVDFAVLMSRLEVGIAELVQLVVALAIAAAVMFVSRPRAGVPQPDPLVTPAFDRWRRVLAGVIGIVGGYLTVSAVTSPVVYAATRDLDHGFVLPGIAEGIFALGVTWFAFFVAPGTLRRRVLAIVIFTAVVVVLVALLVGWFTGTLATPARTFMVFANPYWVVLVGGGLGWLVAAGSRPVAYLALLLAFIVMPLQYAFAIGNIEVGASTLVQLGVSLAVAVVILIVSRPPVPDPAQ
jgi:hypothetical protein